MIERKMVGGSEKAMLPFGVHERSLRRSPSGSDVIRRVAKIGEDVVIVFVPYTTGNLQLWVDFPADLETDELGEQRGLVGELDVRSVSFDGPSPGRRVLRDLRKTVIGVELATRKQTLIGAGPNIRVSHLVCNVSLRDALEIGAERICFAGVAVR